MISPQGLASLRIAASLAHTVPKMRVRIGSDDGVIAEVRSPGTPAPEVVPHPSSDPTDGERPTVLQLTPCRFRKAVAWAHGLHELGRRMAFLDLPLGCDPIIEIGLPAAGASLGGGLYRVPLDGRWLFTFATTLDAESCRTLGADLVDEALPMEMLHTLGVRGDEETAVSIVYAETAMDLDAVSHDRVVDLLHSMLARFAAHQLIEDLAGSEAHHR